MTPTKCAARTRRWLTCEVVACGACAGALSSCSPYTKSMKSSYWMMPSLWCVEVAVVTVNTTMPRRQGSRTNKQTHKMQGRQNERLYGDGTACHTQGPRQTTVNEPVVITSSQHFASLFRCQVHTNAAQSMDKFILRNHAVLCIEKARWHTAHTQHAHPTEWTKATPQSTVVNTTTGKSNIQTKQCTPSETTTIIPCTHLIHIPCTKHIAQGSLHAVALFQGAKQAVHLCTHGQHQSKARRTTRTRQTISRIHTYTQHTHTQVQHRQSQPNNNKPLKPKRYTFHCASCCLPAIAHQQHVHPLAAVFHPLQRSAAQLRLAAPSPRQLGRQSGGWCSSRGPTCALLQTPWRQ